MIIEQKTELIEKSFSKNHIDKLRTIKNLAIGEIAGRDSIAAIIKAVEDYNIKSIIPTVALTGTEFGNLGSLKDNITTLKNLISDKAQIFDIVMLGYPRLWSALNSRFTSLIYSRFGLYSPCLACHLYMHLCRVPLSHLLGNIPIISGERNTHNGVIKLSQTSSSIDACISILKYASIDLLLPLRYIEDSSVIENIVGANWEQGQKQLSCTLSGNYYDFEKNIALDDNHYKKYIEEFFIPSGKAIIDLWKETKDINQYANLDYFSVIKRILK